MATDALDVEASRILGLPALEGCQRLSDVLDRVRHHPFGSLEQRRLLTFNAHLCTRIRELAETRSARHPWQE